jgi:hypothetical protein
VELEAALLRRRQALVGRLRRDRDEPRGMVTIGMVVTAWPRDSFTSRIRVMRAAGVVWRARHLYGGHMTTNTLQDRIDAFNRELQKQAPAEAVQAFGAAVHDLVTAGVGASAPKVGQLAPTFTLPDALGAPIALANLLKEQPVVIAFYRGQWCPYCDLQLRAYQEVLPQITALGAGQLPTECPPRPAPH